MSFFSQVKQLIYDAVSELWVSAPGDAANGLDIDVTRLPVDGTTGANASATLVGKYWDDGNYHEIGSEDDYVGGHALHVHVTNYPGVNVTESNPLQGLMDQSNYIIATDGAVEPKFAAIAAASSGNNTVVAAVADKNIKVLALTLSASAAVNAKFQSAAGGTDLTGLYYLTTNSQLVLPYCKLGWFETAASALLNLSLSGAVPVGGCLTYIEVA